MKNCLSSFSAYTNEIIVGDSGSDDSTLKIAAEFNAKIIAIDWCDDYSYARNKCIAAANNDWILFLDADEFLVNGAKLLKWIERASEQTGGCLLQRKDAFIDHETNKYSEVPIGTVRLFRRHKDIFFSEPVHEVVGPSIINAGYEIEVFEGAYIHHSISTHTRLFLDQKQTKYLKLLDEEIRANPGNAWAKYQKGKTLWYFGEIIAAKQCFHDVIEHAGSLEHKVASLNNLGALALKMNQPERGIEYLNWSLSIIPNQSQAYFIMGDCYLKLGQRKKALLTFLKVDTQLKIQKKMAFIPGGLFLYKYQKYYRLALSLFDFPKLSTLMIYFAIKENPKYIDALYLKYQLYVSVGKLGKAEKLKNRIKLINPHWTKIKNLN